MTIMIKVSFCAQRERGSEERCSGENTIQLSFLLDII